MAGDRELRVRIIGDASSAQRAFRDVDAAAEGHTSKLKRLFSPALIAGAGLAIAGFAKTSVVAFQESEAAQSKLEGAFRRFPQLAGANIDKLRALNSELAKKTKFDDDATASGQAVLAGFKLTAGQITQLTPLLQDYAARTGKDLPTAAQDLGKAIGGQGKALKNIGINFKDTGDAAGNFGQLVDGLRTKVGGFAEEQGKTTSGRLEILRNQFGELQEKVGAALIPALTKLGDVLLGVVNFFGSLSPAVQTTIGVVAGLIVAVLAIAKAIQVWQGIQLLLNATLFANPIGLVVLAIAALVAGVIIAYKNSETFRVIVQAAWEVLKGVATFIIGTAVVAFNMLTTAVSAVVGFISRNWPALLGILTNPIGAAVSFIKSNLDGVVSFVGGLPGRIAGAAGGMFDGIKNAFRSAINFIIRGWNGLEFSIPSAEIFGQKIGGQSLGTPNIPLLAHGGIVQARPGGTLAVLGEGGRDEAVIPLSRGGGIGSSVNVTINMPHYVGPKEELLRVVTSEVTRAVRNGDPLWSALGR